MKSIRLAALIFLAGVSSASAQISTSLDRPQCYEGVGCPHRDRITDSQARALSCQALWLTRNTIFHQRGFCFQTARGQQEFDNSQCRFSSMGELQLNPVERANVATLTRAEQQKACQ